MSALGRKRTLTHFPLSFLESLTIALTGKRFQVIWQLQLRVGGGLIKKWRWLPRAANTESVDPLEKFPSEPRRCYACKIHKTCCETCLDG